MEKNRRQALFSWLFVALMVALCSTLGVLQYRWIGEASRAERDRMKAGLDSRLQRLSRDFNMEIAAACQALRARDGEVEHDPEAQYSARYAAWRSSDRYPGLFRRIAIAFPERDRLRLTMLDSSTGTFGPAEWPPEWSATREAFLARLRDEPPPPPRFEEMDHFGLPHFGPPPEPRDIPGPPPRPPELDWLVVELDPDYLRTALLRDLLQRDVGPDYEAEVVARAHPSTVLYRFGPEGAGPIGPKADASVPIFSLAEIRPGPPRGGPRGGRGRNGRRAGFPPPPPGYAPPPGGPPPDGSPAGRWLLSVRHSAGSLDAVVDRARWRNLAVTSGVLLLLLATIVALVRFTRRAQALADLQMEFVAGVTHELRTPLTVIRTAAHNLSGRVVANESHVQRYGALIRAETETLSSLVEQVLLFSNVRAGRTIRVREKVAINALIENTVSACARVVESAGCSLDVRVEPNLPPIEGDPAALQHALQNLVGNSAKYGAAGGWIGISASTIDSPEKPSVEIRVADRGPGIPRDELGHVFDSFYRGRRAIEDQVHGTGLGLSLVKRIVEAHGGAVSVRTELGTGAEFILRIPALALSEIDEFSDTTHRG